jgi:hypothetical protein
MRRITPTMKTLPVKLCSIMLLGGLALSALAAPATAQTVAREQDIGTLRLGQRIRVDDGSCPAGQVKEVSGTKMTSTGIVAARKCIPRVKPKTKDTK